VGDDDDATATRPFGLALKRFSIGVERVIEVERLFDFPCFYLFEVFVAVAPVTLGLDIAVLVVAVVF
jgi:hypothetical protein